MGHQVEHRSCECPHAERKEHIPQLADGRIGKYFFDVILEDGDDGCQKHCGHGCDAHDLHRFRRKYI